MLRTQVLARTAIARSQVARIHASAATRMAEPDAAAAGNDRVILTLSAVSLL